MNTVRLDPADTSAAVSRLFEARGASPSNAHAVAEHLVESERLGLPSHGLIRVSQYLAEIANGLLVPDAVPVVTEAAPTITHVDGRGGFGQVAGYAAAEMVGQSLDHYGTAFVTVRNVQHTGRLGAYTEPLAAMGNVVVAFASGAPRFHRVVPFGGRDGRLSTNPIAWAAPARASVLSADFSTSATPEGRIRVLAGAGAPAPADTICDAAGEVTTDTTLFYGDADRGIAPGGLLPLGGSLFGHKGYALGLLSELMSTVMSGDRSDVAEGRGNNLALFAIRGDADLTERVTAMGDYMTSSRPAPWAREVMLPGEPERRKAAVGGSLDVAQHVARGLADQFLAADVPAPAGLIDLSPSTKEG